MQCAKNILIINDEALNISGDTSTLNLLTWNIEHFPKNDLTVEYLKDAIGLLKVDIIALQEIKSITKLNQLTNQLGEEWISYRSPGNSDYGQLGYLINTNEITNIIEPFSLAPDTLKCQNYMYDVDSHPCQNSSIDDCDDENPDDTCYDNSYDFAWRMPYVLEFTYENQTFYIINIHFKCCNSYGNEKKRRYQATNYLDAYINDYYVNDNIIVMGDFNGNIDETVYINQTHNVFDSFLSSSYIFADESVFLGDSQLWSFPSYPSHIDHIILSDEIFNNPLIEYSTSTVLIENLYNRGFSEYNEYISDHRPVLINLQLETN